MSSELKTIDDNDLNTYSDYLDVLERLINEYICFKPEKKKADDIYFLLGPLEAVRLFMANQKEQIRMYGSAAEFEKNLKKFGDFPLRRKMFRIFSVRQHIPRKYHNEKGELFYSKQEYLYHLQESTKIYADDGMPADLEKFMKKHEERLGGCYAFVKYEDNVFEEIRKLFRYSKDLTDFDFSESAPGDEYTSTDEEETTTSVPSDEPNYLENFKKVIKEYPHIFLPNKEHRSEKTTVAIRVFKDDGEEFMMESEVFNAVNLRNSDGKKKLKSKDRNGIINTISRHDFNRNYAIENVEYIPTPILRAKHSAVPIVTPTSEFCILASDALIEFLRCSISGLKLFQKIKKDSWIMVTLWIKRLLESHFKPDTKKIYFMNCQLLKCLKMKLGLDWEAFDRTAAKAIREVDEQGFTEKDLEKELKYLGLTNIFPEMTENVEKVYLEVKKNKEVLKTCDMFEAVEKCQLACLFKRFPRLMKFLHNQKACGRYTYVTCDECQKSKKNVLELERKEERDPVKVKEASEENMEEGVNPSENMEPVKEEKVTLDGNKKEVCSSEDKDSLVEKEEEESGEEKEEEENTEGSSDENEDDDQKKEKGKNQKMIKKRGLEGTERYVRSAIKKMTQRIMSEPMKIIENVAEENRMLKAELAKKEEELEKMEETEKRNVILTKLFNEQKEEMKQLKFLVGYFTEANEERGQELAEIKKEVYLLKENKETVEAMEKELEEKKKKIIGLTKQLDDQKKEMNLIELSASKSNEENKKLQERIKRKEAIEIQMKKENTEKMRKMNEEMERIQKKSEAIQMEMTMRQSKMEEELREKDRIIKELQNVNRQRDMEKNQEMEKAMRLLSGQWEEQGKTIKNLLNRFYPSSVEEECPICTDEMETSQETLKCEVCKKKVHLKCASEWHKKNRSCPICRSPQLNPEDYPSLG